MKDFRLVRCVTKNRGLLSLVPSTLLGGCLVMAGMGSGEQGASSGSGPSDELSPEWGRSGDFGGQEL